MGKAAQKGLAAARNSQRLRLRRSYPTSRLRLSRSDSRGCLPGWNATPDRSRYSGSPGEQAGAFEGMADGAAKTNLAVELFGRSGLEMILP